MTKIPYFGDVFKTLNGYVNLGYSKGWDYGIIGVFILILLVIIWNILF